MSGHWSPSHWKGTGESTLVAVPAPGVTAARLTDSSLSVQISGEPGVWYEVYAVAQPFGTVYGVGSGFSGATVTRFGLAPGKDYLIFAVARRGTAGAYLSLPGFAAVSLVSLDSVLAAFRSALAQSVATRAALTGGLWANEVPEDVDLPYGFIELLDSRFLWTTEDPHVEVARVRLHLYAAGGERCELLTRQVRQLYDWRDLPFASGGTSSTVQVMPTDYCVQSEFARLRTGEVVYQGTVEYEVMVSRASIPE